MRLTDANDDSEDNGDDYKDNENDNDDDDVNNDNDDDKNDNEGNDDDKDEMKTMMVKKISSPDEDGSGTTVKGNLHCITDDDGDDGSDDYGDDDDGDDGYCNGDDFEGKAGRRWFWHEGNPH